MNKLERLALRQIKHLAEEIHMSLPYTDSTSVTPEAMKKINKEKTDEWSKNQKCQVEIVYWAEALLESRPIN